MNISKMEEVPYSVYDHLKAHDVISMLAPLLDSNSHALRLADGKLEARLMQAAKDTPWIHVKHSYGLDCGLWHQIIFNIVSNVLPPDQKFVPRNCQSCWKVVVKLKTLQQLFNLLELQKKLDRPSKCGMEVRPSVHGLYGGYFYNKSKEEGLVCYEIVKNAFLENEFLAPLVDEVDEDGRTERIILKRACTEFEHAIGPSDKWEITQGQNAIEDLIETWVVKENMLLSQPEHLIWNIKRRWIEWAWQNGDPTYARYTGGQPLYPAYVTYHQEDLKKEDEGSEEMTMRVAFLKDHMEHKAGDETYIPRSLARNLCQQEITVPWAVREKNPEYMALRKRLDAPVVVEEKVEEKAEKLLKQKKKVKRGKTKVTAVSKPAEAREKTVV